MFYKTVFSNIQKFHAHQGCILLMKKIINVFQFKMSALYFSVFSNVIYFCDGKAEFLASLL